MTHTQGPNKQSIEASGMTVEEWQAKHPDQELGPDPEEIGQETTDPPDGSGVKVKTPARESAGLTADIAGVNAPDPEAAPKSKTSKSKDVDV